MKSIIALMISSIIVISIPGNTANSQLNKELLEGESKIVMSDPTTKIDGATTESIIEDSGRKLTKRSPGGDGGIGSVGWWMFGYNRLDDDKIAITESSQVNTKRLTRSAPGGDGGRGSMEWWVRNSMPGNDVNTPIVTGPPQGVLNRNIRNAPININNGGSSDSNKFSTSTVSTTTDAIDKLRWKWIATGGLKKCSYDMSDVRCHQ